VPAHISDVTLFLALSGDIMDLIIFSGEIRDAVAGMGIRFRDPDEIGNKASI
jgi:hypothetical protein